MTRVNDVFFYVFVALSCYACDNFGTICNVCMYVCIHICMQDVVRASLKFIDEVKPEFSIMFERER